MDTIEQITSAGTWVAQLIRSGAGVRVVGMIANGSGLELVNEADASGGYQPARLGERQRQQIEDDKIQPEWNKRFLD